MLWESPGQCSSQIFEQFNVSMHLHNNSTAEASVGNVPLKWSFESMSFSICVHYRCSQALAGFYFCVNSSVEGSFGSFVLLLRLIFAQPKKLTKVYIQSQTWK